MTLPTFFSRVRLLPLALAVLMALPASFAYAQEHDDEVTLTETEEAPPTLWYLSQKKFEDKGMHFPLYDLDDMTDYRLIADSAQKVLDIFPDDLYAKEILSTALFNLNEDHKAVDLAFDVFQTGKGERAFYLLDYAAQWESDYVLSKVEPAMAKARAAASNDAPMYEYLLLAAQAYDAKGDRMKAYNLLNSARKLEDTPDVLNFMSTILLQTGNGAKAVRLLKPYMEREYEYPDTLRHNYALGLRDCGKGAEALKLYADLFSDLDPEEIDSSFYASLLAALGKDDEAEKIFKRIIQQHYDYVEMRKSWAINKEPGTTFKPEQCDESYTEALLRVGIMYANKGDRKTADKNFNEALESTHLCDSPSGYEANILAWLGDKAGMEEWMKKYGSVDPVGKASLYYVVGDKEKAFKYLAEAFDKHLICPEQIKYDPNFHGIADMPEYGALVKKYKPLKLD